MPALSTSGQYHRAAVRVAVAQICQSLGWQSASSTALDVLVDVMQNHITETAKLTGRYANQFDRTLSNLDDLGLAFRDLGVPVAELEEYVSSVDPLPFPHPVPQLPVPRATNLSFLKPGSQEIVTRPIHVYEHLPPMHPDTAEDETTDSPSADPAASRGGTATSSPGGGLKRPGADAFSADAKRGRYLPEEEGRPMREILSVMMTTSGFISPAREGKLPETRLPDPLDDCGDDYRHVKTRKQRADTYRRLSERENERRNRDRWLREDDLFDIIDVKVEEEEGSAGSSPEKLPTATQAAKLKPFKKHIKSEPGPSRSAAVDPMPPALPAPPAAAPPAKVRPDGEKPKIKKKKLKSIDALKSSKLSIFKKKIAKKKQQGHSSDKVASSGAASQPAPSQPPVEAPPPPAAAPAPAAAPPPKKKVKKKLPPMLPDEPQLFSSPVKVAEAPKSAAKTSKASDKAKSSDKAPSSKSAEKPAAKATVKTERPAARPRSPSPPLASTSSITPPGTPGTPRAPEPRRKPSVVSLSDLSPRSDDSGTPDRPRTPELPGRRDPSPPPPPPDPAALLNNPLIPRFPFPFSSTGGPEVPQPPYPGMPGLRPPALFLGSSAAGSSGAKSPDERRDKPRAPMAARALDPRRSPSDASDGTRSPTPDISAMTPLKRLELEERAEKKKEKEHKKNKKDKKDKKKKDKKDREKKELKSEKKEKKRKEEKEKAPGKVHEARDDGAPKMAKLTLRLNSPDSAESRSPSPEPPPPPKLTIKPVRETPEPALPSPSVGRPKKKPDKKSKTPVEEPALLKPPKKEKEKKKSPMGKPKKSAVSPPKAQPAAVIAETVGSFLDSEGNRIWICPECGRQDDGSPMIGCDGCDDWYHWVCVGIQVPPGDEDWFCPRCIAKMQSTVKQKGKGRGKKK